MSPMETRVMPHMAKSSTPTGGVIIPITRFSTKRNPNHKGSMPQEDYTIPDPEQDKRVVMLAWDSYFVEGKETPDEIRAILQKKSDGHPLNFEEDEKLNRFVDRLRSSPCWRCLRAYEAKLRAWLA